MSPILGHTLLLKGDLQKTTNRLKIKFWPVWPQKQICNNELDWFTTTVNMLREKGAPDSPLSWC